MGFKFQFGDQVYAVDSNKMSTWTRIRTGAVGFVNRSISVDASSLL
mgnify:CR=1 FL=1